MKKKLFIVTCLLALILPAAANKDIPQPTIREKTADMKKFPGFFTFYWDDIKGRVWLEIDKWDYEFLYINSLAAGIGSNEIGLDRNQLGHTRVVKFIRIGSRVLLMQPNYRFRAITDDPREKKAVDDGFARSIIWGGNAEIIEDQRILVNADSLFLKDTHGVAQTLKYSNEGSYRVDPNRSAYYLPATKNFPLNSEFEVWLTLQGSPTGKNLQQVVPSPDSVTVRQHHSFVCLPDNKYQKRAFDPRAPFYGIRYLDFAAPVGESIVKRFISRHRLQKKDPTAKISEPVKPIVYYVDNSVPEPIRSALLQGASWWNQAFEAAGYKNAFLVKILPESAHPLDVRYNVINWVHRFTRGWSYGSTVVDPRTGEIIKGHVLLGSLRVRQDFLIAQGLLQSYQDNGLVLGQMKKMALARIRQLSAHEVGHTLGLTHNYAASANNRASVMDYPHPFIQLTPEQQLDLSDAYTKGIGAWDKVSIAYGYQDFPEGTDTGPALDHILDQAREKGLLFISDADARPLGSAHPKAHLWDNGTNAAEELDRIMDLRAQALNRFSEKNIPVGSPMATLEEVLVPVYLMHRYQLEAASKLIGGLEYSYTVRGDRQLITRIVTASDQRNALRSVIRTISTNELALPERIIRLIPPRPFGYRRSSELFENRTQPSFDPISAAATAAGLALNTLFHPARANRLIEYRSRKKELPSLAEIIDKIVSASWKKEHSNPFHRQVQAVINNLVLEHLFELAAHEQAFVQVKAIVNLKLSELADWLHKKRKLISDTDQLAFITYSVQRLDEFRRNPGRFKKPKKITPPAGSPIGLR